MDLLRVRMFMERKDGVSIAAEFGNDVDVVVVSRR
jgi:hypothetical protein